LEALEHSSVAVRSMFRSLFDALQSGDWPDGELGRDLRGAIALFMTDLATGVGAFGRLVRAEPDVGFTWACWRWAEGASLSEVLAAGGLSPGDFIRQIRQVVDLADQVGNAAAHSGRPALATAARAGVDALRRGVVAYTATV
jgi:ATP-dependent RNA helicase HelY